MQIARAVRVGLYHWDAYSATYECPRILKSTAEIL
jgi:hypothetical protein